MKTNEQLLNVTFTAYYSLMDYVVFHWVFDGGDLWWNENSPWPYPGYWGA